MSIHKLSAHLSFTFADSCSLVVVSAGIKVQCTTFFDTVAVCQTDVNQLTLSIEQAQPHSGDCDNTLEFPTVAFPTAVHMHDSMIPCSS